MAEIKLQRRTVYAVDVYHALLEAGWDIEPALSFVQGLPKTDVAPVRRGRWKTTDTLLGQCCVCSVCGSCPTMEYKYCPYCGSLMSGGADNG